MDVRDARGFFPALDDKVFLEAAVVRAELRGLRMIFEPPTLRHFTARFEPAG
ncbi:MAG TPA: hypothetical protein VIL77_04225 [Gaiellaceae bacterium]